MTRNELQLRAELRKEIHLGTGRYTGEDLYVPLDELKKTSVHIIGAAGYGKSFYLRNLIRQFIRYGQPFSLIDPHRELYDFAVSALRRSSVPKAKVVLVDPGDRNYSVAFNPLSCGIADPGEAASLVLEACLKVWGAKSFDETPRLERILRGTFRLLVESGLTLLEAPDVLNVDNTSLRLALRESVSDPLVRQDWAEFEKWPRHEKLAVVESSQNRLRRFIQSEQVQLMLGQRRNALNLQNVIDDGQYLLANVGSIPAPETQRLLGALLVNAIFHAAKQRNPKHRRDYFLIVDECGQFATRDIANSLDELRKFGVHLILAHQRLRQLEREDSEVLSAVLTNAKVRIVFGGLERPEAERMARELFTGQVQGERVKHINVQTKFRPVLDTFEIETESWSESESASESSGWSSGSSESEGESESHPEENDDAANRTLTTTVSEGISRSESGSLSSGRSTTHGGSRSIVPITRHEEFHEESSRQYWGIDEQWEKFIAVVHQLPKREALVRIHSGPVVHVVTPDVPTEADERAVERFKNKTLEQSSYAQPTEVVVQEIQSRREQMNLTVIKKEEAGHPFKVKSFRE